MDNNSSMDSPNFGTSERYLSDYLFQVQNLKLFSYQITCEDEDRVDGDSTMVKIGSRCQLSCTEGNMWLPDDDRSDMVECIGMYGTYGVGAWNWMPNEWHPGYGSPRLDLRICVPLNYLNRERQNIHSTL